MYDTKTTRSLPKIEEAPISSGDVVLLRVDFNVPLTADGRVSDWARVYENNETITHLLFKGAKVVLLSHFQRPNGKKNPDMSFEKIGFKSIFDRIYESILETIQYWRFYLKLPKEKKNTPNILGSRSTINIIYEDDPKLFEIIKKTTTYKHIFLCENDIELGTKINNLKLNFNPKTYKENILPLFINSDLSNPEEVKEIIEKIKSMPSSSLILLENIRFYPGEEQNDVNFAKTLASLGKIYINNALSCSHRAHASVSAITEFLPSYAGYLFMKDASIISAFIPPKTKHQRHINIKKIKNTCFIIGGKKISTKIDLIKLLIEQENTSCVLIGGAMANTFLVAQGYDVGDSFYEKQIVDVAKKILKMENSNKIILPFDFLAQDMNGSTYLLTVDTTKKTINNISGKKICDIGPKTITLFEKKINEAYRIVWNGPLGIWEVEDFSRGTFSIARAIAYKAHKPEQEEEMWFVKSYFHIHKYNFSSRKKKTKLSTLLIGGGDTLSAIEASTVSIYDYHALYERDLKLLRTFSYISTAGGAMLDFLAGKPMPGINALIKAKKRNDDLLKKQIADNSDNN